MPGCLTIVEDFLRRRETHVLGLFSTNDRCWPLLDELIMLLFGLPSHFGTQGPEEERQSRGSREVEALKSHLKVLQGY